LEALHQLQAELDNIRAALAWSFSAPKWLCGKRLAYCLRALTGSGS